MMQRHSFTRKFMISASLLLVAVGSLRVFAQDKTVVDFYYPGAIDGPFNVAIERYATQFEALHPEIDINAVYAGSYTQTRDTIRNEIASGDMLVDVAVMLATDLYSFVEDDSVIPAQQFIDGTEDGVTFMENFYPSLLENARDEKGDIWAIPFQRSTPLFYYNADLLEAEGIAVPTNNDQLLSAAQQLTTADRAGFLLPVAGGFPIWLYQSYAAAYGQPLVENDPTTVYFNTPETLAAVEYITKLGMPADQDGYAVGPMGGSVWGDTPAAFTSGQAAMIYHTSGSLTGILKNAPFTVGVGFLPSGPAGEDGTGYAAPLGGGNMYIFASDDEAIQQAAWLWVQYLASDEIQSDWSAATGYIAATQGAWDVEPLKSLTEEFPQYLVARDQLEIANKEFDSYRSIDIQNIINATLSGIFSGATPLEDAPKALEDAQAQIDALLAEYKPE